MNLTTRYRFGATAAAVLTLATSSLLFAQGGRPSEKSVTITEGDLKVVIRDQTKSLSGVASLFHQKHAPDVDAYIRAGLNFRCTAHDKSLFGKRGYAILFFANYMNNVDDIALNFRGVEGAKQEERRNKADAPRGPRDKRHPDWTQGGTYRSLPAADQEYDADHDFKLNSWSYNYPRFTKPFYYGRAGQGMVFMLMFDKMYSEQDEIRFSLFKFFVRPTTPRPAWDFQYVIHKVEEGKCTRS